ncbi:hypothetical protein BJ988_000235 [Nocardioides panzhihuensis]|uniref:Uncharacterized protein n=1 Tax=Nocardioides panzhihuensis TaxID=860243 RepID=A0A7Z0DHG6_9ACTN|nr:hypothetical protein [Nocardioides panzhihuensis]
MDSIVMSGDLTDDPAQSRTLVVRQLDTYVDSVGTVRPNTPHTLVTLRSVFRIAMHTWDTGTSKIGCGLRKPTSDGVLPRATPP